MLEAKAQTLLLAWQEGLIDSDDVLEWTYKRIRECEDPGRLPAWLLTLSQAGPEKCTRMTLEVFPIRPLSCDFETAFALQVLRVDLDDAATVDEFVHWLSGSYTPEDAAHPWVTFGREIDDLYCSDVGAATAHVRLRLPTFLPAVLRIVEELKARSA
jgi:hypothetical protein